MLAPWTVKRILKRDAIEEFNTTQNLNKLSEPKLITSFSSDSYSIRHEIHEGIERVKVTPGWKSEKPTLLMLHGMWHNASCWREWQIFFAKNGWESIAISLPGHGMSPEQRPIAECSLPYYLKFLQLEIMQLQSQPILFGHSMGGAIAQWYLKFVGKLKAMVLVAPWTSHSIMKDSLTNAVKIDPIGTILAPFLGWRFQFRNEKVINNWFFKKGNALAFEQLKPELGPESEVVLLQHGPEYWSPPDSDNMPMFWIYARCDSIIPEKCSIASGRHYHADILGIDDAGHDLMLEANRKQTAEQIENWLNRNI